MNNLNLRSLRFPHPASATRRNLFFSRVWITAAIALVIVGMLTGHWPVALLGVLVLVTAGITALWNRFALSSLTYSRSFSSDRAFPGDVVTLTLTVANHKPLPMPFLTIDEEISELLDPVDHETSISGRPGKRTLRLDTSIRPFEQIQWHIPMTCLARGEHDAGPTVIRAGDPFSFYGTSETVTDRTRLLVYPRVHHFDQLEFPTNFPLGDTRSRRHLVTDPLRIVGVRDYHPEDPFRYIHWNATARSSTIQVKQFESVTSLDVGIVLNLETYAHYWEGIDPESVEQLIEIAASIADWGFREGFAVGLFSNGSFRQSESDLHISPASGTQHNIRILTALAKLWPYSARSFTEVLRHALQRMPRGTTVVIVTSNVSTDIEALMFRAIENGRKVVLVPVGNCRIVEMRGLTVHPVRVPERTVSEELAA